MEDRNNPFLKVRMEGRSYEVTYLRDTPMNEIICVQAKRPLKDMRVPYFEVRIRQASEGSQLRVCLAPDRCRPKSIPGINEEGLSVSKATVAVSQTHLPLPIEVTLRPGDVVGLGIDIYRECLLVSVNGLIKPVKLPAKLLSFLAMHPTVSFGQRNEVVQFIFDHYEANAAEFIADSFNA